MPDWIRQHGWVLPAVLAGWFVLLLVAERVTPLRRRVRPFRRRLWVNAALSVLAFAAGAGVVQPVAAWILGQQAERPFGLLRWTHMPAGVEFAAALLLMDLSFYYWHRLNHRVGWLWRFHNVHHVDGDLDVTTSFRFHAVEIAYSSGFRAVQVGLIGLGPLAYFTYEILFQAGTMFHHSNLRLPIRVERALNHVLVTPRMHGVHHSTVREETNSNYGTCLRWWDRLHRTLRVDVPQEDVEIGVPGYPQDRPEKVRTLLTMPFRRQRDYWTGPDGRRPTRPAPDSQRERAVMRA